MIIPQDVESHTLPMPLPSSSGSSLNNNLPAAVLLAHASLPPAPICSSSTPELAPPANVLLPEEFCATGSMSDTTASSALCEPSQLDSSSSSSFLLPDPAASTSLSLDLGLSPLPDPVDHSFADVQSFISLLSSASPSECSNLLNLLDAQLQYHLQSHPYVLQALPEELQLLFFTSASVQASIQADSLHIQIRNTPPTQLTRGPLCRIHMPSLSFTLNGIASLIKQPSVVPISNCYTLIHCPWKVWIYHSL